MKSAAVRKLAVAAFGILLLAVLLAVLYFDDSADLAVSASAAPLTVIIDAGHGDFDPGALGADGTQEKVLNLAIAKQLQTVFEAGGFHVVMTRSDDGTLADKDAVSIAARKRTDTHNRAALASLYPNAVYLSIHQNAFSDRAQRGAQLFYGTLDSRSELLCECIQQSIVSLLQPQNKRQVKRGTDSVYILTHTNAPTALVECGFITNEEELLLLKDEHYRQQLAFAIFSGFCSYLETVQTSQPTF